MGPFSGKEELVSWKGWGPSKDYGRILGVLGGGGVWFQCHPFPM